MNVLRRIAWGVREMMIAGIACCGLATIRYAIGGVSAESKALPFLLTVYAWYVTAAVFGGIVLGLLKPLLTSWLGRGFVGFLVAIPVVMVVTFRSPFGDSVALDAGTVRICIGVAAVVGPFTAAYITLHNRAGRRRDHAADA